MMLTSTATQSPETGAERSRAAAEVALRSRRATLETISMRTQILARALVALSWLVPLATPPATALGSGEHFGLRWSWANLGGDYAELEAGDVDGDGSDEILTVGCSGRCWVLWTR